MEKKHNPKYEAYWNERAETLLNKLARSRKFQEYLKSFRLEFKIPESGYLEDKEVRQWYADWCYDKSFQPSNTYKRFLRKIRKFLMVMELPNNQWWQQKMIEHVLENRRFSFLPYQPWHAPFVEVINRNHGRKAYFEGFICDIRVYEGVSQRDIEFYIKRFGDLVRPSRRSGSAKKIQPERDPDINKALTEAWAKQKNRQGRPKENMVADVIKGKTSKIVSPSAIKKRIERMKKAKR